MGWFFPTICYTIFMDNPLSVAVPGTHALIPAQVAAAGPDARRRFLEFFTANIRNRNTRAAYAQAVAAFFRWCEVRGLAELGRLEPVHVAAYVEHLGKTHAAPSVKQHLAAVRMLFDWLVVGQVVRSNPASVVRGPRHVVNRGRTPILAPEEARQLFESIPTDSLVGLRDRALIGVLIYSFARISAALVDAGRGLFPAGQALVAPAPREGRQAPRDAGPPQPRGAISTPTSRRPGSVRTRRGRCSGRRSRKTAGSRRGRCCAGGRSR